MASGIALTSVDCILKEIMKNLKPFGGKIILLGGDFRQTFPVFKHGDRIKIGETGIKFHPIWEKFKILLLKSNVQLVDPSFNELVMVNTITLSVYQRK